jgi:hypothetical protein
MNQSSLMTRLGKGFRVLAVVASALLLFQCSGVLTYMLTVWPRMSDAPSTGISILGALGCAAGLSRSFLWILIYWNGARLVSTLRASGEAADLPERLLPALSRLTRLLVASCILDFLLLPEIFLMDEFFPFTLSSMQLGLVQLASLLIPQAFGLTAIVLAYLAHQYGRLVRERCQMRTDLELTI